MKDLNDVAKLEKAIVQKYGERAVINPKSEWDEKDELSYQQQVTGSSANNKEKKTSEEIKDGYSIQNMRLITPEHRTCSKCGVYSLNVKDSLYLNKFSFCYKCFLEEENFLKWKGRIK